MVTLAPTPNTYLITNSLQGQSDRNFISEIGNSSLYFFLGNFQPDQNVVPQNLSTDVNDTFIFPWVNMIQGKLITNNNVIEVVANYPWISNAIFTMYDDQDTNIQNEVFFCMVNEGSFTHVWKCLYNNYNTPSTVQPTFASGATANVYQTSDGYNWKYMYSVDSGNVATFSTNVANFDTVNYFPYLSNTTNANNAVAGALDIFKITNQGAMYNNYLDGTFKSTDVYINGNQSLFNLSNSVVSATNGYYTGCILYLIAGNGQGQFAIIEDFVSNTTGSIIQLANTFSINSTSTLVGTSYQIRPAVNITPVGCVPTINCVAMALINATNSNSVYRIEALQRGAGYIQATANIIANAVLTISNTAVIRPINAPRKGHGSKQDEELYCHSVAIAMTFSNSESNTILTSNIYQQIGIIKNPLFANVNLTLSSVNGNFVQNEQLFTYNQMYLQSNCTTNSGLYTISGVAPCNFLSQLQAGQYVYFTNIGSTLSQIAQVNSIVNTSQITLKTPALFSCTAVTVYLANITANCWITNVISSSNLTVTNTSVQFSTGNNVIGTQSGAIGTVSIITRNGVAKGFTTFIDLYTYSATITSGNFQTNEIITQGNTSGFLFSQVGSSNNVTLYVGNFTQEPFIVGQIIGNTSGAIAEITQCYAPELVYGSSDIKYLENIPTVTRQNNQSETFQIILNF